MVNDLDADTAWVSGYTEQAFTDPERRCWSDTGPRPIRTAVWYPAEAAPVGAAPATTVMTGGSPNAPLFVVGRVVPDAPPADATACFPVVLLSHGTGGSARSLGWLGLRLARRGYVAVAVDHHGNHAGEPYHPAGFAGWWERARDLSVALDRLGDSVRFAGRLDVNQVFAAGFSLGGYTVLALAGAITDLDAFHRWNAAQAQPRQGPREFPDLGQQLTGLAERNAEFRRSLARCGRSWRDPRLKAVYAFAPAPPVRGFTTESLARIDLPVGLMVGAADCEAPPGPCAGWLHRHLRPSRLSLLDAPAGHYVFLGEATEQGKAQDPVLWVDPPGVDRHRIHGRAVAAAVALFAETADARSPAAPDGQRPALSSTSQNRSA